MYFLSYIIISIILLGVKDVIVAVLDTGVDYTHPALKGAIWTNSKEIPGNKIDDDLNGT